MKTSLIHKLLSTVRRWNRRNATIRELMALDDQMLADIGLHRSEIRIVVDELAGFAPFSRIRTTAALDETVLKAQSAPPIVADDEPKLAA